MALNIDITHKSCAAQLSEMNIMSRETAASKYALHSNFISLHKNNTTGQSFLQETVNFALQSATRSLLCAVISESPPLLIYTAMSLDYASECAALASQFFHCASAHKTRGRCGSGGQLQCRLMLLTENLFLQGSGCPRFSPGPGKKRCTL